MSDDVFVTGLGIISAIGTGVEESLLTIKSSVSKIGEIKHLKTAHHDIPSAEVPFSDEALKRKLGIDENEVVTRAALLGIKAAREAFESAKLHKVKELGLKIGFINGTTVGGMEKSEQYYLDFINPDTCNYSDYIEPHQCGTCTETIADYLLDFDFITTISTACSSALNSIILGANMLRIKQLDCVIVGGTECLTKFHLNGFNTLMILDSERCKPFDDERAGLNLGEGAAYLVIENEKSVKLRGGDPICKITGWGNSCDAFHQTASSPNGEGAVLSMRKALKMSNLRGGDIDYINAHGTGTPNNDESEGVALMELFGKDVPPISSTKSFTGHTTSAAGGVESVIAILALQHNFIPPNLHFKNKMSKLSFSPVTKLKENVVINNVLNNSFGFGGNNSSIIFSKIR